MRVFKCLVSGDEMFNDSFPIKEQEGLYIVKGKNVCRSDDFTLDGANPSAEDGGDDNEAVEEKGVDVVCNHRLQETMFCKKSEYASYLKTYFKRICDEQASRGQSEDSISKMKAEANAGAKFLLGKFKDVQFFTGESGDNDGLIVLMEWIMEDNDDGTQTATPYLYFFKAGLFDEKY